LHHHRKALHHLNAQPPAPLTEPKKIAHGVYGVGVLFALWVLLPPFLGFYLLAEIEPLTAWLGRDRTTGAVIFAGCYALLCGFGILPTYAPSIVAGWIFGPWLGFPACVIGYLGGSTIGFIISRLASGRHDVEKWIDHWPKGAVIRHALVEERPTRTLLIVSLLRLSPSCPFSLTNLAMASAGVRFRLFILGTLVGMAPRTLLATIVSHWAAEQGAKDLVQLATQQGVWIVAIGIVLLIASFVFIGRISQAALHRALRHGDLVNR